VIEKTVFDDGDVLLRVGWFSVGWYASEKTTYFFCGRWWLAFQVGSFYVYVHTGQKGI
jgi:hypothetical protein